jgi:ribosomal protein S18 acetylase RimI-like enzyme
MVLRKADLNDVAALVKIRLAYLEDDFGLSEEQLSRLRSQLPEYFKNHVERDMIAYIAEEDREFISSVFLLIIEKPANPSMITGRIGNILNVYTKPEYRRRGLAGQLLKQAVKDAEDMELSYLELGASKAGYPLYKKIGFEEIQSEYVPMKLLLKRQAG